MVALWDDIYNLTPWPFAVVEVFCDSIKASCTFPDDKLAATWAFISGELVPMPTLPELSILMRSVVPLLSNIKALAELSW